MSSFFSGAEKGLMSGGSSLLGGSASNSAADAMFGIATPGLFETKCCCQMTKKQRLYGFIGCFIGGILIAIMASFFVWTLNFTAFGICYSLGNIMAIGSTLFIMGPASQCKNMFHKNRALATCIYLGSLIATMVVAFTVKGSSTGILVLVLVGVQAAALLWYSLSYIPFARQLVTKAIGACFA